MVDSEPDLAQFQRMSGPDHADLLAEVELLVDQGLDPRKAWATVIFHTPRTSANLGFKHKNYGFQKHRDIDPLFNEHVVSGTTLWFRGAGSRDRAIARELVLREGLNPLSYAVHSHLSLIMAHDVAMPMGTEGGPKDFFLASPWQIVNTLCKKGGDVEKAKKSITCQREISSPRGTQFKTEWTKDGQPLHPWPCCSMYNSRCDPSSSQMEYFFTIDLDGKHCCDPQSIQDKDCHEVINTFERTVEGNPPILQIIGETIKRAFSELDMPVNVSWHKSIGWKPSWRGYAVGAFFKSPSDAKHFVADFVMPKLMSEQNNAWYNEGLFDLSSYGLGLDRCIGSAKLISGNPNDMRFLNTSPLEVVSDQPLVDLFHRCPNEYLLTVMGWIYPHFTTNRSPHLKLMNVPQSARISIPKRKREGTKAPGQFTKLSQQESSALEHLIGSSLKQANFATGWTGERAVRGVFNGNPFFDMNATGGSYFCVHNECDEKDGFPSLPPRKQNYTPHSSAEKVKFRVTIAPEMRDPEKRIWLRQNCFKCCNTFTRVCPVDKALAQKVMQTLLAAPAAAPVNELVCNEMVCNELVCTENKNNDLTRFIMDMRVVQGSRVLLLKDL